MDCICNPNIAVDRQHTIIHYELILWCDNIFGEDKITVIFNRFL